MRVRYLAQSYQVAFTDFRLDRWPPYYSNFGNNVVECRIFTFIIGPLSN